ncbi:MULTISPECIES: efflux RND transporter periplasmic adaptor subunit [Paenibacillus]|uniref:Subunit MFP of RND efflux transporter n=1 Tax=Paenibacillus naphthalenovorans TaxID=162209 RepID=A0A0U2MV28_9BACL|nr:MULTISPECIES: efflux RND transporter periplasmic adaptor subunit [Paenibacillus]ALS21439.1 subunit MFP of RND efflux transporter [Paenibacillus naphthalenovorans]GCL72699.1 efflux RND transporter periplasmic adaptor subunit [Paenibacillus naphthalenovorans]SDJ54955.1 RND family efflux transporter, MFP subunit [Paenibacillus naphthalenovorans]
MNRTWNHTVKHSTKIAGAVVISAALLTGCSSQPPADATANTAEAQLKTVRAAPIEKRKISEPMEQVADVISSIQMDIVTKAGGDVKEILKKRGDMVNKGEVIFRLDPTDVLIQKEKTQIALATAQQQIAKARQDLADSKLDLQNGIKKLEQSIKDMEKDYNKMRNDYDMGLVTKFQLEQMESQLNNLRLDLESSQNKLKTLESTNSLAQLEQAVQTSNLSIREIDRTLENMEVKATVSGVLTDLPIEVGMYLNGGFRAAQVQQLDPIKIKAELTEEMAKLVRGKTELTFYIPGTLDHTKAKVSYLADVMSSQSKSFTLELEVPNGDRKLKPGMKAQILLTEESEQMVVTVPSLSVVREGGETFVFILVGDQVEKRKVSLGRVNDTFQEVLSGVSEGEQLIVSGQNQLKDKEKVQLAK